MPNGTHDLSVELKRQLALTMRFTCKCYTPGHKIIQKEIEALDETSARELLSNQGYAVLSIHVNGVEANAKNLKGKFSLLLFCHELQALLKAGLSLIEAIETLHEKEYRPGVKAISERVLKALFEGASLSNALGQQPDYFPTLFVAMISASEKTGDLANTLGNYVRYRTQLDLVKKKLISASIYPAILIIVGSLVILFLMLYVVPKFSAIYESKNNDLPWMSELLLAWGRALHEHAQLTLGIAAALFLSLCLFISNKKIQKELFSSFLKFPTVGEKYKIYILARFYRSAGMLLKGGIPIVTAFEMSKSVLDESMQLHLLQAITDIKTGKSISNSMENNQLCTPVAIRMLRVGERSGQMGDMMQYIGEFYDEDIERWLDWFTKLFEPALMAFIGLIVGVIVVLMYMPIFELAGSIQ